MLAKHIGMNRNADSTVRKMKLPVHLVEHIIRQIDIGVSS